MSWAQIKKAINTNLDKALDVLITEKAGLIKGDDALVQNKYFKAIMTKAFIKRRKSDNYGGQVNAICVDSDHAYFGGATVNRVKKLSKINLAQVAQSANLGSAVNTIAQDEDFIYAGTDGGGAKIYKIDKSTLATVASSSDYSNISGVTVDDGFIYFVMSSFGSRVKKLNKLDLTEVAEGDMDYSNGAGAIVVDIDHIYVGDSGVTRKILKSDMTTVESSSNAGSNVERIVIDEDYVYVSYANGSVRKHLKAGLSLVKQTENFGSNARGLVIKGDFLYAGGAVQNKIITLLKSDLSELYTRFDSEATIRGVDLSTEDNTIFYADTEKANKIEDTHQIEGYRRV